MRYGGSWPGRKTTRRNDSLLKACIQTDIGLVLVSTTVHDHKPPPASRLVSIKNDVFL